MPAERTGYDIVREFWSGQQGLSTAPAAAAAAAACATAAGRQRPPRPPAAEPGPRQARRRQAGAAPAPVDGSTHRSAVALRSRVAPVAPRRPDPEHRVPAAAGDGPGQRRRAAPPPSQQPQGLEVVFRPDPSVYDGRFANNAWLQELPKSLTKLTWDNAALISPGTAARLALVSGDVVELRQGGRTLRIPVWLAPGAGARHADAAPRLRPPSRRPRRQRHRVRRQRAAHHCDAPDILTGVELTKTGDTYQLASTQDHWSLEGRNLVRVGDEGASSRPTRSSRRRWSTSR